MLKALFILIALAALAYFYVNRDPVTPPSKHKSVYTRSLDKARDVTKRDQHGLLGSEWGEIQPARGRVLRVGRVQITLLDDEGFEQTFKASPELLEIVSEDDTVLYKLSGHWIVELEVE